MMIALQVDDSVGVTGLTPILAVTHVSFAQSDSLIFLSSASPTSAAAAVAAALWAAGGGTNAAGQRVLVTQLTAGAATAAIVIGLAQQAARVTVVGDAAAIAAIAPALATAAARGLTVVVHVTVDAADHDALAHVPDNVPILVSAGSHVAEAADVALLAQALSVVTRGPVVHVIDGAGDAGDAVLGSARLPRFGLAAGIGTVAPSGANATNGTADAVTAFAAVAAAAAPLLSRRYAPFLYDGPPAAGAVIIARGDAGACVAAAAASSTSVGVLRPLLLQPWSPAALLAALPRSAAHVTVLGGSTAVLDAVAAALRGGGRTALVVAPPAAMEVAAGDLDGAAAAALVAGAAAAALAYAGDVPLPPHRSPARAPLEPPAHTVALWALSHDGVAATAAGSLRLLGGVAAPAGSAGAAATAASARFGTGWMAPAPHRAARIAASLTQLRLSRRGAAPGRGAPASVALAVVAHPSLLEAFAVVDSLAPRALLLVNAAPPPPAPRPVGNTPPPVLDAEDDALARGDVAGAAAGGGGGDAISAAVAALSAVDRAALLAKGVRLVVIDAVAAAAAAGLPRATGGSGGGGAALALQAALFAAAASAPGGAPFSAVAAALEAEQRSALPAGAAPSTLPRLYAAVRRSLIAVAPALLAPPTTLGRRLAPSSLAAGSDADAESLGGSSLPSIEGQLSLDDDGRGGTTASLTAPDASPASTLEDAAAAWLGGGEGRCTPPRLHPAAAVTATTTTMTPLSVFAAATAARKAALQPAPHAAAKAPPSRPSAPGTTMQAGGAVALHRALPAPWARAPPPHGVGPVDAAPAPNPAVAAQPPSKGAAHLHAALALTFPDEFEAARAPAAAGDGAGHSGAVYVARVAANVRLTPQQYDRNVFHLDIDITGTGLRYDVGSALGVHGHNDAVETARFLEFYGVAPDAVIDSAPAAGGAVSLQTAFRIFSQQVDIFGRPGREFYAALAPHAADKGQAAALAALGDVASPRGAAAIAEREAEGVTFADVLREFASARPPLRVLLALLPPIKPRHYSIASAQRAHPLAVHLLVVEVAWVTPSGRERSGQCSRYLASLRAGNAITISVLPSEMLLPPDRLAPVVLAGLGTGMAPFRAFIQERTALAATSGPVGPVTLYFGARHRDSEFLYGDELEAAAAVPADDPRRVLAALRPAFSRDGRQKVYIQHLMEQDGAALWDALVVRRGSFYLCGPTWPEADVEAAIAAAFTRFGGLSKDEAGAEIRRMKEQKRYVLEVY